MFGVQCLCLFGVQCLCVFVVQCLCVFGVQCLCVFGVQCVCVFSPRAFSSVYTDAQYQQNTSYDMLYVSLRQELDQHSVHKCADD